MRQSLQFLALVAATASASKIHGFNYGATGPDGIRTQANFETAFATAKSLVGTDEAFTSARLYTMIQGGTTGDVTSAIPAAIAQGTTLLLGLWASGTAWDQELAALSAAIKTYGTEFTDLVTGISVGSEDLYRNSPTGISAGSTIGQQPDTLVEYIKAVRSAIAGTSLSSVGVGHVDTWTAWVNGTNAEVIENCDWLGFDGYPYWQFTDSNVVTNGKALFVESYEKVVAVAGSKDVWVTETGWAVTDDNGSEGEAIASTDAAKTYWDDVGCGYLFGNINTYWYTLSETGSTPNFGVSSSDSSTTPLFDLSCSNVTSTSTSSSSSSSATAAASSTPTVSSSGVSASTAPLSSGYTNGTGSSNSTYSGSGSRTTLTPAASSTSGSSGSSGSSSGSSSSSSSSSSGSSSANASTSAAMANVMSAGGLLAAGIAALVFAL